ncbi:hypothetical protein AAL_08356 [Moelleriella libera RCEF 2490]|uniref:Tat pathway signal sequence n=1 Tax=Moelleriella libera RCEF 2490 TaxID=1081109 RepID=A0A166N3S9_9HYPO|nr:hypothetical protein AAL_08356 [Moelleriella libera RCEF 2490]
MPQSRQIQYQPLRDCDSDDNGESTSKECRESEEINGKSALHRWWISAVLVQFALIVLYTGGAVAATKWASAESAPDLHGKRSLVCRYSPQFSNSQVKAFAGLVVKYEMKMFDPFPTSVFSGEPRPESALAWHNLMNNMTVRVTREELEAHNQTSVELPNGGHLAWIGAFHELHCVKILRRWAWREHFMPNLTAHQKAHQMVHVDHCLEALRNAAICRADTQALAVFKWDPSMPQPMLNTHRTMHRCVNWDAMMTSHESRFVSKEEVANMKNPLYDYEANKSNKLKERLG